MSPHIVRPFKKVRAALKKGNLDAVYALVWSKEILHEADKKGRERVIDLILSSKHAGAVLTHLIEELAFSADIEIGELNAPLTLLRYCVRDRRVEIVKMLLENGARVDEFDPYDGSLIHEAVAASSPELVRLLIAFGAPVDHALEQTVEGRETPLHLAVAEGEEEIVNILLAAGADPTRPNYRGECALHLAARFKHPAIMARLALEDISLDIPRHDNATPLHVAASKRQEAIVALLLREGVACDLEDDAGWTPLHLACSRGDATIVEMLLSVGADRNKVTREEVPTRGALIAAMSDAMDIADVLGQNRILEILSPSYRLSTSVDEVYARTFSQEPR